MVCKLAGVLIDFVIGLPGGFSGSGTSALPENRVENDTTNNRSCSQSGTKPEHFRVIIQHQVPKSCWVDGELDTHKLKCTLSFRVLTASKISTTAGYTTRECEHASCDLERFSVRL